MVSSGLLRRVALVRTDVSEEPGASFIRVTKIGELEQHKLQLATDVRCKEIPSTLGISSQRCLHVRVCVCVCPTMKSFVLCAVRILSTLSTRLILPTASGMETGIL
jgi:hypothetical protein